VDQILHQNHVCGSPLPNTCHMPCPPPSSRSEHRITLSGSTSHEPSHYAIAPRPLHLVPLKPEYVPQHLIFSHILSLRSSVSMRDQVSHPYKNKQNSRYLYFNLHNFGNRIGKQMILDQMIADIPGISNRSKYVTGRKKKSWMRPKQCLTVNRE